MLSSFFWEILDSLDGIQMELWTEYKCRRPFQHLKLKNLTMRGKLLMEVRGRGGAGLKAKMPF